MRHVVGSGEGRSTGAVLPVSIMAVLPVPTITYSVQKTLGVLALSLMAGVGATLLHTLGDLPVSLIVRL